MEEMLHFVYSNIDKRLHLLDLAGVKNCSAFVLFMLNFC